MEVKEIIREINNYRTIHEEISPRLEDIFDDVISLLQVLGKYKEIVEEMEAVHCGEDGEFGFYRRKLVRKLKQKYFPKEKTDADNNR